MMGSEKLMRTCAQLGVSITHMPLLGPCAQAAGNEDVDFEGRLSVFVAHLLNLPELLC